MRKELLLIKSVLIICLLILTFAGCAASGTVPGDGAGTADSTDAAAAGAPAKPHETSDADRGEAVREATAVPETDAVPEETAVPETTAPETTLAETADARENTAAAETTARENTAAKKEPPNEEKLVGLISKYLGSEDASKDIDNIKACLKQLEGLPDVTEKNPYYWYVKALVSRFEGDPEAAAGFMGKAAAIAPNNRDIGLWQKAYEAGDPASAEKRVKLGQGEPALDGDRFNFEGGTMWAGENGLLATVEKDSGTEAGQSLVYIDVETMRQRTVYKGASIELDSVTPDGRYALLYDGGLRLVSLETGETVTINEKGLYAELSPDGKKLAYCADGLWIYDMETGENARLDDGTADASPIWFPDGKSLLFISGLGGEESADAAPLQGLFRIPSDASGKKERIEEAWQGNFRHIEWILAGEIFRAEEAADGGSVSSAYYLYTGFKETYGGDGAQSLAYRQDNADYLYITDDRGGITLTDLEGMVRGRFEYGNIWGSAFGLPVKGLEALQGSSGLLLYYKTPLENAVHVFQVDGVLGNPGLAADIPVDSPLKAAVNATASRAVFSAGADELLLVDLKQAASLQQ